MIRGRQQDRAWAAEAIRSHLLEQYGIQSVPTRFSYTVHYGDGIYAVARRLTSDRGMAEEVVQEAFAGLHRHWAGLRDEAAAVGYLRTEQDPQVQMLGTNAVPRCWRTWPEMRMRITESW